MPREIQPLPFDGILVVDKPRGKTSHDVVEAVRRLVGFRGIGHLGTLDPLATGVLVLALGRATRLARFYSGRRKRYSCAMRFGFETDTYDADGEALARQSAESYEKSSSWGNAAWAEATLARNLVGEGKLTDAENAAAKAIALSGKSTGQTPRYEAAFADASVKTKTGKTAEARRELEATLTSAHKLGYRLYEYQARLALAEIELQAGSPSAISHLSALEKESRGHGASLIANQAQELLTERKASAR